MSVNFAISDSELMHSGHLACPGCSGALAMRYALKALGKQTVVVLPACCWSIINGPFPYSSVELPLLHCAFETAGSTASGVRAGLDMRGKKDVKVLAWAGDGGTFDIGLQSLSGAAERNEDFIYACYDNEAYMNTGIQRSSATPLGAWTTTTPLETPKSESKKNIMEIMAAHRIPYAATATVAFPDDLIGKFQKAASFKGTKFIHILAPCPPGWKIAPEDSINLARLAVRARIFPLYEVLSGTHYSITMELEQAPVEDYIKPQGRFSHLTKEEMGEIQKKVNQEWEGLKQKAQASRT